MMQSPRIDAIIFDCDGTLVDSVPLGRFALICLALLVTSSCAGVGIGVYKGMTAVGGEFVDPSQKARVLAEGIAEAMNCGASAFVVFFLPTVVAFVMFLRSPRPQQP